MIKGNHITKSFDEFLALDDVSFHVPKGAVYGLVGPNGSGKSTLLRHITGVFKPDGGEILVKDLPVYENPEAKAKIAFIPDEIFYFNHASILDMKKYYKGLFPNFDDELFEKLRACFSGLDVKMPIRRMSKGMQKQAAFWLAICMKPEVLILDEPVDGLDPVMRRQIWSILLSEVSQSQMTVMVSSHNLRELEDVCDYVGMLHHGKMIIEKSLSDLQDSVTKLQIAFEGDVPDMSSVLHVLHQSSVGRVHTVIAKGTPEEVFAKVQAWRPLIADVIPLTLEEVFIYELGGLDYEIKDILI